jgi:hypothetical protein
MTEVFLEGNVENAAVSRQFSAVSSNPRAQTSFETHFQLRPPLCTVQYAGDFDYAFTNAINSKER